MAQVVTLESRDIDDQAQALNGFRQTYEQLGRGRFHGQCWHLMSDAGFLLREQTNRSLRQHFRPPAEHVTMAVPLAVTAGSVFAGRPLDRESLLVLDFEQEYDLLSAGELDVIGLAVHRDVLATLAPAKAQWLRRAQAESNLPLLPEAAAAIRQMLLAVSYEAEQEIDALSEVNAEAALLSATLTQTLVLAMAGDPGAQATHIPRRADTRLKVVKRAIDYMRAHLHDDIGIAEICSAACASRRSLQYCFEEFMHTTPQAYLRALRLNEARRALKLADGQPITALASQLGFASASHFTRHYKLMFDELPSETLKAYGLNPTGGTRM
jgi:AraC family ethanolamine operon transcriptional activator